MRHSIVLVTLAFFSLCYIGSTYSSERPRPPRITSQSGPNAKTVTRRVLDAGRLAVNITDRGYIAEYLELANDTLGWYSAGSFWLYQFDNNAPLVPLGAKMAYDQGPWVIGKINGTPGAALVEWAGSYMPGPIINGLPALDTNPKDSSRYHPYRISGADKPEDLADYQGWPSDLGAPVDEQGHPHVLGDQLVWCVYNGADSTVWPKSWRPLIPNDPDRPQFPRPVVEVQQAMYAHQAACASDTSLLANVIFIEWTFINKGVVPIDSCYLALWTDMDNDAGQGRPAVDTALDLSYCWTMTTPLAGMQMARAAGYVLLYGPTVPDPMSTALVHGQRRAGYRNLRLSGFFGHGADAAIDSVYSYAPHDINAGWNLARGFDKLGRLVIDPTTQRVTQFPYSGDPVTGTGWLFTAIGADEEGFMFFSGPFNFAPGDTQWMMTALIPADTTDYKQSVTALREYARRLHGMSYEDMIAPSVAVGVNRNGTGPELPARPSLAQNYPNPFNPTTAIRYEVPAVSSVRLSVYDLLGREVAVLVNEIKYPGVYTVQFDGAALASGMYFSRLEAGGVTLTRSLCLIR